MSATTDAEGKATASGAFTADVTMTAKFHATAPMVGGTIDNFQGNAVGSGWSVKLRDTPVTDDGTITPGETIATGQDGVWTGTAYGADGADAAVRPTGIYGGFNAHFTDGRAAGAYATRK